MIKYKLESLKNYYLKNMNNIESKLEKNINNINIKTYENIKEKIIKKRKVINFLSELIKIKELKEQKTKV